MTRQPRVLQRVVFPGEDLDVIPLYLETNNERGAAELAAEMLAETLGTGAAAGHRQPTTGAVAGELPSTVRFGPNLPPGTPGGATLRRSAVISEGKRVSFATYFNAFPAGYWRRWTSLESVTLRIRMAGPATVVLYRSSARGHCHPIETIVVDADEPGTIERSLPLASFIDGGWYWFDIVAGQREATLLEAEWAAPAMPVPHGRLSIGMPTINRPGFVLEQLRTLGEAPDVLDLLDAVYVVDQGTDRVSGHPDFPDAAKKLGDRLRVIEQPNLGGSGGFSRVMDEAVRAGRSDYVLLLDDDIRLEPESILRAAAFADLARKPTIVGGHMFSLYDRAVLHAYGETVARRNWWWGHAPGTMPRHDFGRRNLRNTPWLHRRVDGDYNGWWMCLIPTRVISELGLAIPVFLKWDDAEYGLRAGRSGYPTVSLPGVACWHIPWLDKTDAVDWGAYYHARNRIVVALLHSPVRRGGRLVTESAELQLQSLLSMRYSTAALRLQALEDVLSGPAHLHRDLATRLGSLREFRLRYSDAQAASEIESFPPARGKGPVTIGEAPGLAGSRQVLTKAASGTLHQLRRPRKGSRERPQIALAGPDAAWWVLGTVDSALVSAQDGATAAWHRRDRKLFFSLGIRSLVLHARLRRRWPALAREYRAAAEEFTSPRQWRAAFGAGDGERARP